MTEEQDHSIVLHEAALAYKAKFGDTPTVVLLDPTTEVLAAALLWRAIARRRPFKNDAEWFRALGMEPPPPDALI